MAGILGILGVSVSVIIIAIGGGFSGPGPSILNPPTAGDLWHVGEGLTSGTQLNYSLTSLGAHTSLLDAKVSLTYAKAASPCELLLPASLLVLSFLEEIDRY